jgi:hypothetical protein
VQHKYPRKCKVHENQLSLSSGGLQAADGLRAMGHLGPGFLMMGLLRPTIKWIQARQGRESLYRLSRPEIAKRGVFENPGDTEGRDHKGSPRRLCGLTK